MKKLRWGLLSTAHINRRLIPAIRSSQRSELMAVASRNIQRATEYARQWNIPLAFGSYEAMLDSPEIDAVYISLPNHLHAAWSIQALKSGKHVLCEKPIALSVDELDEMEMTSQDSGRVLAEALMYQYHPQTKIALDLLQAGKIGRVFHTLGIFTFKHSRDEDYRLLPDQGGGSLWDIGIYPISFTRAIFQRLPDQVLGKEIRGSTGVDMSFWGELLYETTRGSGQFFCSFETPYTTGMVIFGETGRIEIPLPFTGMQEGGQVLVYDIDGKQTVISVEKKDPYLCEIEGFEAAVFGEKPLAVSLAHSRDHIRTINALRISSQTGNPVNLAG
jgi:xylose dehydrogenase (NAD/NADP)